VADYEYYLPPGFLDTGLGAALTRRAPDDYWLDVYLSTWPQAAIHNAGPNRVESLNPASLNTSYFVARGAYQPVNGLWVVPQESLVITGHPGDAAPIQMVGWIMPQGSITPGTVSQLKTIWVTRTTILGSPRVSANLVLGDGEILSLGDQPLIDHYTQQPAEEWQPYRFHAVMIDLNLPVGTAAGVEGLRIDLMDTPQCEAPCSILIQPFSAER
jgi:hypothetical protein